MAGLVLGLVGAHGASHARCPTVVVHGAAETVLRQASCPVAVLRLDDATEGR